MLQTRTIGEFDKIVFELSNIGYNPLVREGDFSESNCVTPVAFVLSNKNYYKILYLDNVSINWKTTNESWVAENYADESQTIKGFADYCTLIGIPNCLTPKMGDDVLIWIQFMQSPTMRDSSVWFGTDAMQNSFYYYNF